MILSGLQKGLPGKYESFYEAGDLFKVSCDNFIATGMGN